MIFGPAVLSRDRRWPGLGVATNLNVTLPSTPNAEQPAAAAKLKSMEASTFDVTYDQIQVQGHQASIAVTNSELSAGSDQTVKDHAQFYLPVANMHLVMAPQTGAGIAGAGLVAHGAAGAVRRRKTAL